MVVELRLSKDQSADGDSKANEDGETSEDGKAGASGEEKSKSELSVQLIIYPGIQ